MLIILLNIIPVFNDDRFGLFLKFIYLNSSCYIFVWCWFFLSLPIYRSLIDPMSVQIFFFRGGWGWGGVPVIWTLLCYQFFMFFVLFSFTFLTFDCCEVYVKGMICWVHRVYLENLQRSFFSQLQKRHHHTDLPFCCHFFLPGSSKWVSHFELDVP